MLVLGTSEMSTPESMTPKKLLVETGLVDDQGVNCLVDVVEHEGGGLVDELVVVVGRKWSRIVKEVEGKKSKILFFFSLWQDVSSCWLGLSSPGALLPATHPLLQIL